jgi:tetratricopeptide (TPR) repeat protein
MWSKLKVATMRNGPLIVAWISALLTLGAGGSVLAQQQSQTVPDTPQPQKKAPEKTPEDKASADKAAPAASTKDENAFPEAVSQDAAKAAQTPSPKKPGANENPFPEAVSRDAAKAAGNDPAPAPAAKRDLPPGVSSSSQSDDVNGTGETLDPARAKKDAEVGGFYLKSGDYQGALQRYKDATAADPTNVDAIFGLAEAQQMLKKKAEAAQNYQLYLDIVPNGPKAKQALKALKALGSGQ